MVNKVALFVTILALLSISVVYADSDEHGYINAAIHAKGGKWVAGETSMSVLSQQEREMRVKLHKPASADGPVITSVEAPTTLGTSLDWRAFNSTSMYVTPVRNQGSCGSCWAFAAAATLESSTLIKQKTPGYDLNLAEQILVSCSGAGSCNGGSVSGAANYIKATGLPAESYSPYTATNGTCSSATSGWQLNTNRIDSWSYVSTTSPTVDGIKNALATYGPLATTMAVYNDFFSYRSGVYAYATGSLAGYHAIQIIGYDDAAQCFIVKNSWGTGWGEAGFFRIAYSELNSPTQFGDYTIAYVNSSPTPSPDPSPLPCSFTISPTSATFQDGGGTGSISVSATSSTCTWTVTKTTDLTWIGLPGTGGTGSGTISYTIAANTGTTARSGSIVVAGKTFTINQKAPRVTNPKGGRK